MAQVTLALVANNPETLSPILLLTRPQAAARALVARLPDDLRACLDVVISPILEIQGIALSKPIVANGLILTSTNGVEHAVRQDVRRDLPVFCVGQTTARAALDAGWAVSHVAETADELVLALSQAAPEGPLVHLHGRHTRGDIAARLTKAGVLTSGQVIYDQVAMPLTAQARAALTGETPIILPVFSPRSAQLIRENGAILAPLHAIALSQPIAEALEPTHNLTLHVCDVPTRRAMDAAIREVARPLCRVEGP